MSQATTNNEQLLQNCRTQRTQLLMLTSGHEYARALRSPNGQAASRALIIILKKKKKTKKHPLAANNITLTGTGVGCEFFSMCNFRGPQPSDMQMRRQAQPRSQQPTANSKQQTANSQKQKCTDGWGYSVLSLYSFLCASAKQVPSTWSFCSIGILKFFGHPTIEYLSRCEVAVNLSWLHLPYLL
jgi:hypothetical protein